MNHWNTPDDHCDYRRAISDLCASIYRYDEENEAAVLEALKVGTLGGGRKHTDEDIAQLKDSQAWKQICDPYLHKIPFVGTIIRPRLKEWITNYKVDHSEGEAPGRGCMDPIKGKKLFTPDTKAAVEEAFMTCDFLHDILPLDEMYRSVPPSLRSMHGLSLQKSNHGESRLESFQGPVVHMANTNMRDSLADVLTLNGTARFNVDIREQIKYEKMDPREKKLIPSWLHGVPVFYKHSNLAALNNKAASVGAPLPFLNVHPLPEDNGEVYLSEYFKAQQRHNAELKPHPENDRCPCCSCANNSMPLPHQVAEAPKKSTWNPYKKCFVGGESFQDEVEQVLPATEDLNDESVVTFGDDDEYCYMTQWVQEQREQKQAKHRKHTAQLKTPRLLPIMLDQPQLAVQPTPLLPLPLVLPLFLLPPQSMFILPINSALPPMPQTVESSGSQWK